MKRIRIIIIMISILLCQGMNSSQALAGSETSSAFSADYIRLILSDIKHTITAPSRWQRREWRDFSLYTAGIGTVMLLDKPLYEGVQRNRTEAADDVAGVVEEFGSYPSFGIMGAFYAAGSLAGSDRAKRVAMDAFASSIVSAGLITTTLKVVAGRSRPREEDGTYRFKPFGGDHSFPSGHTTQAFSLASVIAEHYDNTWIDLASYGIASLVGLARVEQEAHFPSDVVAGAAIGTLVGKSLVRFNSQNRNNISFSPVADGHLTGILLTINFRE